MKTAKKVAKCAGKRSVSASVDKAKSADRDAKGRAVPGNKIGVKTRFGNGQPVDRGGRPANSVKGMAREIAGEEVKLNDGSKAPVLRLVVNSVAKKAMGGDVRAAEVFAKWHDGDGDLARTQRYLFTMENLAGV